MPELHIVQVTKQHTPTLALHREINKLKYAQVWLTPGILGEI